MKWFERFKDIRLVVDYNDIYGYREEFLNSYILLFDILDDNEWSYIYIDSTGDMIWYNDDDLFFELSCERVYNQYFAVGCDCFF